MTADTITEATDLLENEQSIVRNELDAFRAFERELRELPITIPESTTDRMVSAAAGNVVDLYRETLMEVSSYGSEYDGEFRESIEIEFSPRLADELMSAEVLTPELKRSLLAAARAAGARRTEFLDIIETERRSLESNAERLAEIEERLDAVPTCSSTSCRIETLIEGWRTLDELERQCDLIATERQQTIDRLDESIDSPYVLTEYLYAELGADYPVLRSIADTLERIDKKRCRAETDTRTASRSGSSP